MLSGSLVVVCSENHIETVIKIPLALNAHALGKYSTMVSGSKILLLLKR